MLSGLFLAACLALFPLFSVLIYVVEHGLPALSHSFFTEIPKPVGESGGGMGNALLGTGILVVLGSLIGIPVGVGTGVYLSEYGTGKLASCVRFATELLSGIPSIIIGIFVYSVFVVPMKRYSAIAGGASLAIIMIPTVARVTEELLKLVPVHLREAGLALGISRWKVTLRIILRGSIGGITTGVMLAIARVMGETAPLLFTALNSQYWPKGIDQPMASLPVQIYTYAISPYDEWHAQAWSGALVLVLSVLILNLTTRLILRRQKS